MKDSTFNFKSTKDRKTDTHNIVIKGDLGIRNAVEIKKKMIKVKLTGENVKINVSEVKNMDITFLQLLNSLKNSLLKKGKKVEITTDLSENIEKLMMNSGFDKTISTELK